jgi:hypothetical protein
MSSSQIWLGFHFASAYKEVAEETKDLSLSERVETHTREIGDFSSYDDDIHGS